ncbi:MAG: HD domain-containing protein [Lachnospiraceae bacterium]|nr:HD domain-containing protein [Lachnospiraceae bacterium]MBR1472578.1 HD domain-containing protein [Lachnospiraceae bacterium]
MIFVATEKLKKGMRLAKPIYNKQGVMLYERNSKLTTQGIQSVRNFGLIGLYILEPAEPLPPFTEADREFERFQTMSVFTLQEIMQDIANGNRPRKLEQLAAEVVRRFGNNVDKIGFTQNLRSPEDNVYKHSLNVAILSAAIYGKLTHNAERQRYVVISALLHDIGSLSVPAAIAHKKTKELTDEDLEVIERCKEEGYRMLRENCDLDSEVMKNISYMLRDLKELRMTGSLQNIKAPDAQVETLKVAYLFDTMTAMKYGEEPQSDVAAYKFLHHPRNRMNQQVVRAMTQAVRLVPVGCTVQFTNGTKGIVLTENEGDILRPFVLSFQDNKIYNLGDGKIFERMQIKDLLKTMDNRYVMTDMYEKYLEALRDGREPVVRRN